MTAENEKLEKADPQEREQAAGASASSPLELAPAGQSVNAITGSQNKLGHFEPDEIISGRYRIISEIGQGGMGAVYKAEQVFLHATYAIKVFDARHSSPSALMRFQREAQAAHELNHPNLVRVHDFGTLEDSTPFLVMDLVEGKTLASIIKEQGRLPVDTALKIFLQLCDGLAHAHERGIVHRDLKPSNIMVQASETPGKVGEVKILDFGIAKVLHENEQESLPLTKTGEVFGSPLYMSPEQCYGRSVDQRSDIYSLGCSLYEALTGLPPFAGDSALSTMLKHQNEAPLSLRETLLGEKFPDTLEMVISRLLAKDPARRYQSASAVKGDLLSILENRAITSFTPSTEEQKNKNPSPKTLTVAVAAVLIVATVGLLFWALGEKPKERPAEKPKEKPSPSIIPPARQEGEILAEIRASMPSAIDKYFAANSMKECKKGSWSLSFPSTSIGWIWNESGGQNSKIPAQGRITFPSAQPLGFKPNMYGCMETGVFKAFRPDELYELILGHNAHVGDDVLRNISHLEGLKKLNLDTTPVTDDGLTAIAGLPNLQELNVSETDVTADGILRLKSLNRLECLEMGEIENASKVLRQMSGKSLRILRAQSTLLRDEDLQVIAGKFPKLTHLFIKNNKDVSDRGIALLNEVKNLSSLDVRNCTLTPDCIPHFKNMASLRNLDINLSAWTASQKADLARAIPQCTINSESQ